MDGRPQVRPRCYQFSGETSSIRSITVSDKLAVLSAMMSSAVRLKLLSDVLIFAEIKLSLSPARLRATTSSLVNTSLLTAGMMKP